MRHRSFRRGPSGQPVSERGDVTIAYEDPRTGELFGMDGESLDEETTETDLLMFLKETIVTHCDRARDQDREIRGPAEDARGDAVHVKLESTPFAGD